MLPKDPFMLLSYINTQLRDNYSSLEKFCDDKDISSKEIIDRLSAVGYSYSEELNKFI